MPSQPRHGLEVNQRSRSVAPAPPDIVLIRMLYSVRRDGRRGSTLGTHRWGRCISRNSPDQGSRRSARSVAEGRLAADSAHRTRAAHRLGRRRSPPAWSIHRARRLFGHVRRRRMEDSTSRMVRAPPRHVLEPVAGRADESERARISLDRFRIADEHHESQAGPRAVGDNSRGSNGHRGRSTARPACG